MPPGSRLGAVERDPSHGARPSCGSLTMFAAADFGRRSRSLAAKSVHLPPPGSKSRRGSAGRTPELELIKGGYEFQSDCGCARPTLRPPLLRNRPAFPDRPHPGGPAVYRQLETSLQLEGVHRSPALRRAGLLLGERRALDARGSGPALEAGPYDVPPTARPLPIHGSRHLARCARRRGRDHSAGWAGRAPVGGCSAGRGELSKQLSGTATRIFLPTLVLFPPPCPDWSARHFGPSREREKSAHFSSFLRRPWLFKVLRESALIPGLENRSDLFIFGAGWEEA